MNVVESVVGCFVGLWCLFATRCEGVLVSGVYREFWCIVWSATIYCIYHSYNIIFSYTSAVANILIYTGYPLSHPFAIYISITSINWLTDMYSHFLVLRVPHTGPNAKARSRWDNTFTSWGVLSEGCLFCSHFTYVITMHCGVICYWVKWCLI